MPSSQTVIFAWQLVEPHSSGYNRTCQDYFYTCDPFLQEYKCQAKKRKNKSALSSSLILDTVH